MAQIFQKLSSLFPTPGAILKWVQQKNSFRQVIDLTGKVVDLRENYLPLEAREELAQRAREEFQEQIASLTSLYKILVSSEQNLSKQPAAVLSSPSKGGRERPPRSPKKTVMRSLKELFDPNSRVHRLQGFVEGWSSEKKQPISEKDLEEFTLRLQKIPSSMLLLLHSLVPTDSLLTKVLLVTLDLLPPSLSLHEDEEILKELSKSQSTISTDELSLLTGRILETYRVYGPHHFLQDFRPLSEMGESEWKRKIEQLPSLLTRLLADTNLTKDQFFFLANRLGLLSQ